MIRRGKLCKQTLENTLSLLYLLPVTAGKPSHQWPADHFQWMAGFLSATSAKSSSVLLKQNKVDLEVEISANVLLYNRGIPQ
ncbi:hypothetical protein CsSME_00002710 [Camellia sinensis var. sinensis]